MLTTMLFVKDLAKMSRFYEEVFDLELDEAAPGFLLLLGEGTRLGLHELPPEVAERIQVADPPQPRSEVPVKLLFSVPDVSVTTRTFERLGGQLFATTNDDSLDGVDPEGNVLRITA